MTNAPNKCKQKIYFFYAISSKFLVMELMSLLDQAYDGYQMGKNFII